LDLSKKGLGMMDTPPELHQTFDSTSRQRRRKTHEITYFLYPISTHHNYQQTGPLNKTNLKPTQKRTKTTQETKIQAGTQNQNSENLNLSTSNLWLQNTSETTIGAVEKVLDRCQGGSKNWKT